uniref:Uncharacterized protein n=1 Tax=Arundo donax TaxID=35708 RepID=A0A0A9HQJ1_ARUDO
MSSLAASSTATPLKPSSLCTMGRRPGLPPPPEPHGLFMLYCLLPQFHAKFSKIPGEEGGWSDLEPRRREGMITQGSIRGGVPRGKRTGTGKGGASGDGSRRFSRPSCNCDHHPGPSPWFSFASSDPNASSSTTESYLGGS